MITIKNTLDKLLKEAKKLGYKENKTVNKFKAPASNISSRSKD